MEANLNSFPNLSFQNAYQQINFYSGNKRTKKPLVTCSTGPSKLAGIFANSNHSVSISPKEQEVIMCAQPFYVGQVDHNIQQIGLMAVKQVRYVDDDQWQQMIRDNQKYIKAMQQSRLDQIREVRKSNASAKLRNQRGQFVAKQKPLKKKYRKVRQNKQKTSKNRKKEINK